MTKQHIISQCLFEYKQLNSDLENYTEFINNLSNEELLDELYLLRIKNKKYNK